MNNNADGDFSTVSGGRGNDAHSPFTTVCGGRNNDAKRQFATVCGGDSNFAYGFGAVISGGADNLLRDNYATIAGGANNQAGDALITTTSGEYASVGGGLMNTASGSHATVPGGTNNLASGAASFAAGNQARAIHDGAFVWADNQGSSFESTGINQALLRADGGVGINTDSPVSALTVEGDITPATSGSALGATGNRFGTLFINSKIDHVGTMEFESGGSSTMSIAPSGTVTADSFVGTVAWADLSGVPSVTGASGLSGGGALTSSQTLSIDSTDLSSCTGANDKVLWDSVAGRLTCGTDGGGQTYQAGTGLTLTGGDTFNVADGGIGSSQLADNGIVGTKVAAGEISQSHLDFNVATQSELDAHKSSSDHDSRYYEEGDKVDDSDELDGLESSQFLRADSSDVFSGSRLRFDSGSELEIEGQFTLDDDTELSVEGSPATLHIDGSNLDLFLGGSQADDTYISGELRMGDAQRRFEHTSSRFEFDDMVAIEDNLAVGGHPSQSFAFNTFGDPSPTSSIISSSNDVYIHDDLEVRSDAMKPTGSSWSSPSDARVKKDIEDFRDGLSVVKSIRPVSFEYNGLANTPQGLPQIGVIAQEIQPIAPYTVTEVRSHLTENDTEHIDLLVVNPSALTFVSINAIQELDDLIMNQNSRIEQQQMELLALRTELAELRAALGSLRSDS